MAQDDPKIAERRHGRQVKKAAEDAAGLTIAERLTRRAKEQTVSLELSDHEGDFWITMRQPTRAERRGREAEPRASSLPPPRRQTSSRRDQRAVNAKGGQTHGLVEDFLHPFGRDLAHDRLRLIAAGRGPFEGLRIWPLTSLGAIWRDSLPDFPEVVCLVRL